MPSESATTTEPTFADHVRARVDDDNIAVKFGDSVMTYRVWCAEVARRAAWD